MQAATAVGTVKELQLSVSVLNFIFMQAWLYSTAFSPVHSWGFENYAPIGQHLKTCPYNVRSDYPDKVQVMGKEAAIRKKKLTKKESTVNEI